jgi:4-amino-4-deoxy-L-arabinose transferase-like glycosyltransferase
MLAGLLGHDPWKPDEAYTFGLVYHILQSGEWLVPTLAGEPFVEKPPLFFWTAALFARAFGDVLRLSTSR